MASKKLQSVAFGEEMRKQFCLSPDYTFTNHGSWGATPRCVLKDKIRILEDIESNPDKFTRWEKDDRTQDAVEAAAKFVGADPNNLVLVKNATTGVNSVLKSLRLKSGDAILVNNLTYPAIRHVAQDICARVEGAQCQILEIEFPIQSEDAVVELFDNHLKNHPEIKLVIIDHISSGSALLFPIKRLIEVCRSHGTLVMIDGAHSPGQLPIVIEEISADFYTGNLHKWCYVPRGCAVLWVDPRHQGWVRPIITSYNMGEGFNVEFRCQGTMDHSSFVSTRAGLDFYNSVGGYEKIHSYISDLSHKAAAMLEKAWGTHQLPVPASMRAPNMKVIKIPPRRLKRERGEEDMIMKEILERYNVVGAFVKVGGSLFIRISTQIYNTMVDYEVLRDAVLDLCRS